MRSSDPFLLSAFYFLLFDPCFLLSAFSPKGANRRGTAAAHSWRFEKKGIDNAIRNRSRRPESRLVGMLQPGLPARDCSAPVACLCLAAGLDSAQTRSHSLQVKEYPISPAYRSRGQT